MVLARTWAALRPMGLLYLSQPVPEDALVVVRVNDEICFRGRLPEPNFFRYVKAGNRVVARAIVQGQFDRVQEIVTDAEQTYPSIQAMEDGLLGFGEDAESVYAMAAAIRQVVGTRETTTNMTITIYSQDRAHLLRKPAGSSPE